MKFSTITRTTPKFGIAAFVGCVIACLPNAYADGTYSIDFHIVSPGGSSLHNSCYKLSGTVGQASPGYSSGSIYALLAGYWQAGANAAADADTIFFNGFEGC